MKWLQFILSHSIFVAICAVALSWQTLIVGQRDINFWLLGFIFFSTLFSYNIYWYLSKQPSLQTLLKLKLRNVIVLALSAILAVVCLFFSSTKMILIWPAILLNGLYILPLIPIPAFRLLRKLGFLKTTLLAFTWSYVTVVIPLSKSFIYLNDTWLVFFLHRFLFMLLLCIIFDSRDLAIDKIKGLHSLATDTNPLLLKAISLVIFIALLLTNYQFYEYGLSIWHCLAFLISSFATAIVFLLSLKKRGYFFYYFFADGLMLFSALLSYMASI